MNKHCIECGAEFTATFRPTGRRKQNQDAPWENLCSRCLPPPTCVQDLHSFIDMARRMEHERTLDATPEQP